MAIRKDDYDVIEDTISDFSYFYDEEEEFKRNRKIIRKYKILSIGIFAFTLFVIITIIGIVRMSMYDTDNILTKNEIRRIEWTETVREANNTLVKFNLVVLGDEFKEAFYSSTSGIVSAEALDSYFDLSGWGDTLADCITEISEAELPTNNNYYEQYNLYLTSALSYSISLIEALISESNFTEYQNDITELESLLADYEDGYNGYVSNLTYIYNTYLNS